MWPSSCFGVWKCKVLYLALSFSVVVEDICGGKKRKRKREDEEWDFVAGNGTFV